MGRSTLSLRRIAPLLAAWALFIIPAFAQDADVITSAEGATTETVAGSADTTVTGAGPATAGEAPTTATVTLPRIDDDGFEIGRVWRERFEALGIPPETLFSFFRKVKYTPAEQRALEARQHYFVARHYLENDEHAHAIGEFRAALEIDPTNSAILLGLAQAHASARQFDDAERVLNEVISRETTEVQALILKADILLRRAEASGGASRKQSIEQAIAALEQAKAAQPRNMEVLKMLAAAHVANQDIARIITAYRDILAVNPRDTYSLLILGNVLSKIPGRQEEAIPYFERVIELRRGFINTYIYLAQLYHELGRHDQAIATYKQALLVDPRNEQALRGFDQAIARFHDGRPTDQQILRHYDQFAKEFPYSPEIQRLFADKLMEKKELRRAVAQYHKVLYLDSENVEALIALGNVYVQEKDIAEATKYFSKAVDINPDKVEVYEAIAESLNEKDPKAALEIYRRALKLNPKMQKLYMHLATLYQKQGNTSESITVLEQARREVGDKTDLLTMLGAVYDSMQQFDKAQTVFELAYQQAPDNRYLFAKLFSLLIKRGQEARIPELLAKAEKAIEDKVDLYSTVGEVYVTEGKRANAVDYYVKALEIDPHKLSLYASLLHIYNLEKQFDKSLQLIEKARAMFGETEAITRMQAETLLQKKDYDGAIEILRKLVQQRPDSLDGYRMLADALNKDNRYDDALQVVKQAEERLGKSDEIQSLRGVTLYQQKRYSEAERIYRDLATKELGRGPGSDADEYYYYLGSIYLEQKRFDSAERALRRAIQLNPQNDNALNALGYMFADMGQKLPEAKKLIEQALEINPNAPHIIDSLGWVYFKQGDLARARELIEHASNLMGDDPEIFEHLGDISAAQGDIQRALDYWKKSLQMDDTRAAVKQKIQNHER